MINGIKFLKTKLDESLDEGHRTKLWALLEELQGTFIWHKGKLGHYYVGEHSIDTHGLPPYQMTPRWLSFWEESEVNQQIQVLVDLGKMHKNAFKYACRVILLVIRMVVEGFVGTTIH